MGAEDWPENWCLLPGAKGLRPLRETEINPSQWQVIITVDKLETRLTDRGKLALASVAS